MIWQEFSGHKIRQLIDVALTTRLEGLLDLTSLQLPIRLLSGAFRSTQRFIKNAPGNLENLAHPAYRENSLMRLHYAYIKAYFTGHASRSLS